MKFTREQKKEAYEKLPPEVQSFVMDNENTELIGNYLKEAGLSEEQSNDADGEILYVLYGLQTLSDAIVNIAKLSNKNINEISGLKTNLENNIFDKIAEINAKKGNVQTESVVTETQPQNNIGNDFEQIILNQARAMQPARPVDESGGIMNYESRIMEEKKEPPSNLPVSEEPKVIHNYIQKSDPYREPIN